MPSFRHTSPTVKPLAKSRSASRSTRATSSAFRRLRMGPSVDWVYRGTNITPGPVFGVQTSVRPPYRVTRRVLSPDGYHVGDCLEAGPRDGLPVCTGGSR